MEKKTIYHLWKRLTATHYVFYLFLCVLCGVVAVTALRANNQHMIGLREKVFAADQADGDVEVALRDLREFVYAHMNTDLSSGNNPVKPPIQLKYRYERLVAAEKSRTEAANTKIYNDAQNHCEQLFPGSFSGGPRVPCIKDYVDKNGTKAQPIPDDLYKFDFLSPTWSPDLAGLSLLAMAIFFVMFIFSAIGDRLLRYELRH